MHLIQRLCLPWWKKKKVDRRLRRRLEGSLGPMSVNAIELEVNDMIWSCLPMPWQAYSFDLLYVRFGMGISQHQQSLQKTLGVLPAAASAIDDTWRIYTIRGVVRIVPHPLTVEWFMTLTKSQRVNFILSSNLSLSAPRDLIILICRSALVTFFPMCKYLFLTSKKPSPQAKQLQQVNFGDYCIIL